MTYEEVVRKTMEIPHLDLGISFDPEAMKKEVESLGSDIFQPYRSRFSVLSSIIGSSWQGFSLLSSDGELHTDLQEDRELNSKTMQRTRAASRCPNMMKAVNAICDERARVRVMRVMPGGRLTWHSHQFDITRYDPENLVIHVPIVVPEKFRYSVINIRDFRLGDIEKEGLKVYTENYPAGRATMFNSAHMHNVFNDDVVPRISMMINVDLRTPNTYELVKKAIENYEGPLLT